MVKALTLLAFIAAPAAYVMAQDASPTGLIPTDIPTDVPDDYLSSIASYASEHAGDLSSAYNSIMSEIPTEYQNSVSSLVAEATKGLGGGDSAAGKVTIGVTLAGAVGVVAAAGMLL
ncbi:hypothetical protein BDA99DRAFT_556624 [Phascolomyces articulosus]|uniref:Uncharacterized protein n=1 Tax=Phascolomyces articulosus TaxID=60185 RepID=A0AAD5K7U8_9FUNG|nr:hypothetical protein BDA99DRAFT_556624 [Phascolomyces articulosus]